MARVWPFVLLFKECVRLAASMLVGVALGGVAWFMMAVPAMAIVGHAFPPSNGGAVTVPSLASLATLFVALVLLPFAMIAGGWMGWCFAIKPTRQD